MALSNYYQANAADWRAQIKTNQRKTRMVIATFLLIYVGVGLIVDLFVLNTWHRIPPERGLSLILHGYTVPYATLLMSGIAIVSLLIAYALFNRIVLMGTEYREVTPENIQNLQEKQLYNILEEMKVAAGLTYMPRLFIIEANYMNAFASGYSEKSAMIAVTEGLLDKLSRTELQAVIAHELSHIRHYDIKLTLTVAILSNILLIVVDVLFYGVLFSNNRRNQDNRLVLVIMLLRYILPLLTVVLMLYLSRKRELMADAGSVELMRDNEPLARALIKIHDDHEENADSYRREYSSTSNEDVRRAAYIFDPVKAGIEPVLSAESLFSTHPTLRERLSALGFLAKK